MPRASLTLHNGTQVNIQGSEEEIARIIRGITEGEGGLEHNRKPKSPSAKSRGAPTGPTDHIRGLVDEGFFRQKRGIGDIQKALEAEGHIYATTTLSPLLVRLTRNRVLRRLKEEGAWKYVGQ